MSKGKSLVKVIVVFVIAGVLVSTLSLCAVAQEKVEVTFPSWWFGEPGNKEYFEVLIDAFEKRYPNIDIKGYYEPYPTYWDKIVVAVSAGTPPDIIHSVPWSQASLVRMGAVESLNRWIEKTDILDRWPPLQKEPPVMANEKVYGLIQMVANYIPIYNKRLYAEAGIKGFPDTPEEFFSAVKKLTKPPERYGYACMVKPGNYSEMYMDLAIWVIGCGGHFSKEGGIPTANSPEVIEAIRWYKRIYDAGITPKGMDKSTYRQMWWVGKVATLIDGSWMWGFAEAENPAILKDLTTALTPFPGHRNEGSYQSMSISKASKHKEEAWKFFEFFASQEWQIKQVEMTKCVTPARGSATPEFLVRNPWFKNFAMSMDTTISVLPPGLGPYCMEVMKIIADNVEDVLFTDKPVEEAMNSCQQELEDFLASK